MIYFFKTSSCIIAAQASSKFNDHELEKVQWLFHQAEYLNQNEVKGIFIGPRKEMITPWSTNAVEIAQNMGIEKLQRIEEFTQAEENTDYDPMLREKYHDLDQEIFKIEHKPEPVDYVDDIKTYNEQVGLALSDDEIQYLENLSKKLGRQLTDSEVFGFSQLNSEHCRHKIFNGTLVIDGIEMMSSLFSLIRKTSRINQRNLVSAYKDNVAFIKGNRAGIFAPLTQDKPDFFSIRPMETIISLKAETHNFPTTVEPFSGSATGSGGEIRDRMAGGKASMPLAGTAVYMTPYPRNEKGRKYEEAIEERPWLYHTPADILTKASDGASDYGNKFGQPLICGSLLTFEHHENDKTIAYDKVVMLAGGIGYANMQDSKKEKPEQENLIVVLGGANYRIGMGGSSISSVSTGQYDNSLELNAVQRSNPEMQKRIYNVIRAMAESDINPIRAIHDHGAGGHLNSLSELLEESGGTINIDKLPLGAPTLSAREILGNESQERMALIIRREDLPWLEMIAGRERAPLYVAGEVTGDKILKFHSQKENIAPINLNIDDLFDKTPKTTIHDETIPIRYEPVQYDQSRFTEYLKTVLQLEAVACKDWLTNKVDRSVSGRVAMQQTTGPLQLPLNNLGITTLDYLSKKGIATAIGHAPAAGVINPEKGSMLSTAEALTNIVWAPIKNNIRGISLSANWMWPVSNEGESTRLYRAVQAASDFAIDLGINIPTGKDSLSMKQKYPDGKEVIAPGTVIISAAGQVTDFTKAVSPVLKPDSESELLYVDFSKELPNLGGSSLAQSLNTLGDSAPTVGETAYFKRAFNSIQHLIDEELILAGHDISAGGIITTLLEMTFARPEIGIKANTSDLPSEDPVNVLFSENPGVIIQVNDKQKVTQHLNKMFLTFNEIGTITNDRTLTLRHHDYHYEIDIDEMRDIWFRSSYLMEKAQSGEKHADLRFQNYKKYPLEFRFPQNFRGNLKVKNLQPNRENPTGIIAAIIREKGINGDREMAWAMHLAGFDVKDVHMTDLVSGAENLEDVNFIVFVGGFSNSDVLGSAKGWAGTFLYNEKAQNALDNFYKRDDTLSLGVCNGCQLMNELELIYPAYKEHPKNHLNESGKFESAFLNVEIPKNNTVMLHSLAGSKLGIWVAHGEGKINLTEEESDYNIPLKYTSSDYPDNPNGTPHNAAAIASHDGRHLAVMPHPERSVMSWQWPEYPDDREKEILSPWIDAFINAVHWIKDKINK